jgi:hypothetical protein
MADSPRFAYVQARTQARHGERPGPEDWRVAEASADLAHYLEALKRTGLQRWLAALSADMPPEAIEREIRASWLTCVDETAAWAPGPWRPALAWLRWLAYLPAIEHLLGPRKVAPWMREDPILRGVAFDDPGRRRQALAGLPLSALDPGEDGRTGVVQAWLAEWRRRIPGDRTHDRQALELLVRRVGEHVAAMREGPGSGNAPRLALKDRLTRMLRREAGRIGTVFAHLGLTGLELERARAGVLARRLMPDRPEGRSWA